MLTGDKIAWRLCSGTARCGFPSDRTGTEFAIGNALQEEPRGIGYATAFPLLDAAIGYTINEYWTAHVVLHVLLAALCTIIRGGLCSVARAIFPPVPADPSLRAAERLRAHAVVVSSILRSRWARAVA
jgi:hypothetical protein